MPAKLHIPIPLVPLESGDRLTRKEFHRRYSARPDITKAELIQGVVYVSSPERFAVHSEQQNAFIVWLGTYAARRSGVRFGSNATIFIGDDSEVQPDGFLFRDPPPSPGAARETATGYLEGAPQLVVEIAASSAAYDLHDKMEVYRRAGVHEYIVWQVFERRLHWFRLRGGEYVRIEPNERDVIESEVFPGLRLAVTKMLALDLASVLDELAGGEST